MKTRICLITAGLLLFLTPKLFAFPTTFTPRISASEEFSDNLFLSENNQENEFITTITPGFSLDLSGRTSGVNASYDLSYAAYNEFDENNTWRHDAVISGWADITKNTRIEIRDNFIHTEDPLSEEDLALIRTTDPNFSVDTTERRGRNRYSRNVARLNFIHRFGQSDSFRLGYTNIILENEDPTLEDNTANEPSAGLTWWFLPRWGFDMDATYSRGEYEISDDIDRFYGTARILRQFTRNLNGYIRYSHTIVNYDGVTEDDRTYNPSIGINYDIEEDISFTLDIGYYINAFDLRPDQSGMTVAAILTKRFRRGSIAFTATGGYNYALFGTTQRDGFENYTESAVSATYAFTRQVSGNIRGAYRYSDYVDIGRQDDRAGGGVGLTITPLNWMSIGLRYSYRLLESTIATNDYQENRALITVNLYPSVPYRTRTY